MLSVAHRRGGAVRVRVLSRQRKVLNLGETAFRDAPEVLGTLVLPTPFAPHNVGFQREVSDALEAGAFAPPARRTRTTREEQETEPSAPTRGRADEHPVHACPDLDQHLKALRRIDRARRTLDDLDRRIEDHSETLARTFDRVLQVLEAWDVLDGWALTERGERLMRVFHESDLLVTEAVSLGLFDGLDAPQVAALASCFTYEHRSPLPPAAPWFPSSTLRHRVQQLADLAADLNADELRLRLPLTRPPDPGFVALAHAWASGAELADVLDDETLSGGDFVRNIRLLIDLLGQLALVAPDVATADAARAAGDALFRGVVAATSVVGDDE